MSAAAHRQEHPPSIIWILGFAKDVAVDFYESIGGNHEGILVSRCGLSSLGQGEFVDQRIRGRAGAEQFRNAARVDLKRQTEDLEQVPAAG